MRYDLIGGRGYRPRIAECGGEVDVDCAAIEPGVFECCGHVFCRGECDESAGMIFVLFERGLCGMLNSGVVMFCWRWERAGSNQAAEKAPKYGCLIT